MSQDQREESVTVASVSATRALTGLVVAAH